MADLTHGLRLPDSTATLSGVHLEGYADAATRAQLTSIRSLGIEAPSDIDTPYFTYLLHHVAGIHSPTIPHYYQLDGSKAAYDSAIEILREAAVSRACSAASNLLQDKSFGLATVGERAFYEGGDQTVRQHGLWDLACHANSGTFRRPDYRDDIPRRLGKAVLDIAGTAPWSVLSKFRGKHRDMLTDIAAPTTLSTVDRWIGNHARLREMVAASHRDGTDLAPLLEINRSVIADGRILKSVNRMLSIASCEGYCSPFIDQLTAAAAADQQRHAHAAALTRRFPKSKRAELLPTAYDVLLVGAENVGLLKLDPSIAATFTAPDAERSTIATTGQTRPATLAQA